MNAVEWAQVVATLVLGASGLVLANSYRRQVKVKLAEKLLESYKDLWDITSEGLLLHKSDFDESALKNPEDRKRIGKRMREWYGGEGPGTGNGNGLLMSAASRGLFFFSVRNLQRMTLTEGVNPPSLQRLLDDPRFSPADKEDIMACRIAAQLSRLRSQLKADMGIYRGSAHLRDSRI
jgi:hypothetical protein